MFHCISRFLIETTWAKQNGNLQRNNFISIDASGSQVEACFEELGGKKSYILMLARQGESNIFTPIEPPVQSDRKRDQKHRQHIWEKVCAKVEGQSACQTRVSVPISEDIYRGRLHLMECKVESSTKVVSVKWDKDGSTLGSTIHERAGISVSNDETSAIIIIQNANHIHNGRYGCTATSADGQTASGYTQLRVVGPEEALRIQCKAQSFCFNKGTCHEDEDGSNRYCVCPRGFEGHRCERITIDALPSSSERFEEMENKMSGLTVAMVVVVAGFVIFIIFASIHIFQLRKKLSKTKNQYTSVKQNDTIYEHPVEVQQTTNPTNGVIGVTLSRVSVEKTPEGSQSRRSSAITGKSSSLHTIQSVKHELTTPRGSTSGSPRDFDLSPRGSISRLSISSGKRERLNAKS